MWCISGTLFFASNAEDSWGNNQCSWICGRAFGIGEDSRYTEWGINYDMYKIFWFLPFFYAFLMPKYLTYVFCPCFTALPCDIIIQLTHFLFIRACCNSLFWHKGTWEYLWLLHYQTCFLIFCTYCKCLNSYIQIRLRVHCEFCPGLVLLSYFVLTSFLLKHV